MPGGSKIKDFLELPAFLLTEVWSSGRCFVTYQIELFISKAGVTETIDEGQCLFQMKTLRKIWKKKGRPTKKEVKKKKERENSGKKKKNNDERKKEEV